MQVSEDLSTLIGDIYDAALDATLWVSVLGKTRDFVGGHAASLLAKTTTSKTGTIHYQDGRIDEHYVRLYFEKYMKLDPCTTGQFFAEVGEPISTMDLFSCDEMLETRFYKEWVRPQGLGDFASTVLDKSPTTAALFGVFRLERHGLVDDEMRRRLRLVVPHLRRAVLVGQVIDLNTATAAGFADCLDSLTAGMFLVAATGTIVHANVSGHVMLVSGDVLRAVDGRLVASDADSDQGLQEVLAAAAKGDSAVGIRGISQPLVARPGSERYVAHVMPLTSGARRRTAKHYAAAAVLCVHKVALQAPSAPEVIAKTYNLTPTELRVLLAIVQVAGVSETRTPLASPKTRSRRICATCSTRLAPAAKPTSSGSWPGFPIRSWASDMTETEQLSHLIGDIYDAALDPALWAWHARQGALLHRRTRQRPLFSKDAANKTGNFSYYDYSIDAHYQATLLREIS